MESVLVSEWSILYGMTIFGDSFQPDQYPCFFSIGCFMSNVTLCWRWRHVFNEMF